MEPYFKGWKTIGYWYSVECSLGGGIKKLNSVMNDSQKIRFNGCEWNHILKDDKPLVIDTSWSLQLGGEINKLNSVMTDGQKVRVLVGEWNHILKDGKPLLIETPWSKQHEVNLLNNLWVQNLQYCTVYSRTFYLFSEKNPQNNSQLLLYILYTYHSSISTFIFTNVPLLPCMYCTV